MYLLATWTPEAIATVIAAVTALVTALGAAVVAVYGALKGQKAQGQADAVKAQSDGQDKRLDAQSAHIVAHEQALSTIQRELPPPAAQSKMAGLTGPLIPPPPKT